MSLGGFMGHFTHWSSGGGAYGVGVKPFGMDDGVTSAL